MGRLFRRIAAAVPAAALIAVVAAPAGAAPLSADEPVPLGFREIAPGKDKHPSGMAEAFRYTATEDGPVDVINVYVERAGRRTKLHAGIYTDRNGRPSQLLGASDELGLRRGRARLEQHPDLARRAREGQDVLDGCARLRRRADPAQLP